MFKLVVLSALVAVAVAAPKPQVHQTAISYSSPAGGHSSSFAANASPVGISSSSSSSFNNGDFLSNTAHAVSSPAVAYAAPGYHGYTPSGPFGYSAGFASSQAAHFSTPSAFAARDFHDNTNFREYRHENNNGQRFH